MLTKEKIEVALRLHWCVISNCLQLLMKMSIFLFFLNLEMFSDFTEKMTIYKKKKKSARPVCSS